MCSRISFFVGFFGEADYNWYYSNRSRAITNQNTEDKSVCPSVLMAHHSNIEVVDMSIKCTSSRHGLTHRWLTTQTQTRCLDAGDLYFAYRGR